MDDSKQLKTKLSIISNTVKLGHETFKKSDLDSACSHILNNSGLLVKYNRSCIVDFRSKKPKIISIMGQPTVKKTSEYSLNILQLITAFNNLDQTLRLDKDSLKDYKFTQHEQTSIDYFDKLGSTLVLVPLLKPDGKGKGNFIWILESFSDNKNLNITIINLLSQYYSEAVWYHATQKKSNFLVTELTNNRFLSPLKLITYAIIIIILALIFARIHENIVAEFELVSANKTIEYAPYMGKIKKSFYKNGSMVNKDSTILEYNNQEMLYKIAEAKSNFDIINTDLDRVNQKSFSDQEELGKIKLLEQKLKYEEVEIEKLNWYLSESVLKAGITGVLVIDDDEKWTGRAVNAGEKLYEVISPTEIIAEVFINEANASVIKKNK